MIITSLILFFFFWLYNYSEIASPIKNRIQNFKNNLIVTDSKFLFLNKILYPLSCSFCFAFWITLIMFFIDFYQQKSYSDYMLINIFTVPVIHLFIDLIFKALLKISWMDTKR